MDHDDEKAGARSNMASLFTSGGGGVGGARRRIYNNIETPVGLRVLTSEDSGDFSGFREDRGNMRRIISAEREIRYMRELIAGVLEKQDDIIAENKKLSEKVEQVSEENKSLREKIEEMEKQHKSINEKCVKYEDNLQGLFNKVETGSGIVQSGVEKIQLEEMRNAWKKEQEEEQVKFSEVVKKQILEKTKDTVIQVIKEKEVLVRDTVDKKKCMVIFGLNEKKNPNKFAREREEREVAKQVIKTVQDSTQNFDQEVEEVIRLGRFQEGRARPLKVRLRSQMSVEEIMARSGKLADNPEYKDVWVKRDMNSEERERERTLRNEAKEKNEKRSESEKKIFYWRVLDMRLRKWYLQRKEEEMQVTQ